MGNEIESRRNSKKFSKIIDENNKDQSELNLQNFLMNARIKSVSIYMGKKRPDIVEKKNKSSRIL